MPWKRLACLLLALGACSANEEPRRACGAGLPACDPGEICSEGFCFRPAAVDAGDSPDAAVSDAGAPDAGPGGPPYRVHSQAQSPGVHEGRSNRYRAFGHVVPPASGRTNRLVIRGGVAGGASGGAR